MFKEASSYIESSISTALVLGVVLHHAKTLRSLVKHQDIVSSLRGTGPARGGFVAQALSRIMEEDHRAGRPLTTSVVVGEDGHPGEGYFNQARTLGYRVGTDQNSFWNQQLLRLGILSIPLEQTPELREAPRCFHTKAQGGRISTVTPPGQLENDIVRGVQSNFSPSVAKHEYVYIPAGQLQVGDKVVFPSYVSGKGRSRFNSTVKKEEITVSRIKVYGPSTDGLIEWESSDGRVYRMPILGVHMKVRVTETTSARMMGDQTIPISQRKSCESSDAWAQANNLGWS